MRLLRGAIEQAGDCWLGGCRRREVPVQRCDRKASRYLVVDLVETWTGFTNESQAALAGRQ